MRRLKSGLVFLVLGLAITYGVYIARLSYTGYCFAEGKYMSDEEKIKVAVADVLKKYPPAIVLTPVEPNVWSQSTPEKPIYYHDVDEFLSLNPTCCKVTQTRKELEGSYPTFTDRLTGTVSSFVGMDYWVRYWGEDNTVQAIKSLGYLPLSNCGKPVRWWTGYQSFSEFIYQIIKNRGTT